MYVSNTSGWTSICMYIPHTRRVNWHLCEDNRVCWSQWGYWLQWGVYHHPFSRKLFSTFTFTLKHIAYLFFRSKFSLSNLGTGHSGLHHLSSFLFSWCAQFRFYSVLLRPHCTGQSRPCNRQPNTLFPLLPSSSYIVLTITVAVVSLFNVAFLICSLAKELVSQLYAVPTGGDRRDLRRISRLTFHCPQGIWT